MENKSKYLNDCLVTKTDSGILTYRGPMLTTAHIRLLSTLLLLATRQPATAGGSEAFAYSGSMREMLITAGYLQPSYEQYDATLDLLSDMASATISYTINDEVVSFSTLIVSGSFDDDGFTVYISAELMKAYQDGHITRQRLSEIFPATCLPA